MNSYAQHSEGPCKTGMAIKASIHSEGQRAESNQQQEVQQQEKQVEAYELLFISKRAFPLPAGDGGRYSLIMFLIKVNFINPTN